MKIITRKFKSGERYVFIVDSDGVPDFWVTHFVTQKLRLDHASSSIRNYLKNIIHFKKWEQQKNRDVLDEIYTGKMLSDDAIKSIKEYCRYNADGLKNSQSNSNNKIVDMGKFYISKGESQPTVGKSKYITRIAHIAEFLHFVGIERVKFKPTASTLFDDLADLKKRLKADLPKGRLSTPDSDKSSISDDVFEDFVNVAKPQSPNNPFTDPVIRFRNYLIVQIFYETGFRAAELLALRISDIGTDTDDPTLRVVRRHDSKEDPRLVEPTAKTLGREISITEGLRAALNEYISKFRNKTKVAKSHPFIFVSHKAKKGKYQSGEPIGYQTVAKLLCRIKAVNPERFWGMESRQFRHFFNDRLSSRIDQEKVAIKKEKERLRKLGDEDGAAKYARDNEITDQRELEIRASMNGHSSLDSGLIYLKRTIKKKAATLRKQMIEDMNNRVESSQ